MKTLKYMLRCIPKSFVLFGKALKNSKRDFWISIQALFWVSLLLSIVFYFAEHAAQPTEYRNWWQSFVWTVTRYIGDPGHFAGEGPITLAGRFIDTFIGILKILIYAVPAGIVAKSYQAEMEADKKANHLQECREKMWKSFKRIRNTDTGYRVVPRNISLVSLAVKYNLTENDIIETVGKFEEFRLCNLGDAQSRSEHPHDRLAVELIPFNKKTVDGYDIVKTSYGIKINRSSNVTIVAPTADREASIGSFAYYLAQFGGFNLISRLFVEKDHDRVSYLTLEMDEKTWEKSLKDFVEDIKNSSPSEGNWNIIVTATKKAPTAQVHFAHKNKSGLSETTLNGTMLNNLFSNLSNTLNTKYKLVSDMDNSEFLPVGKKNIAVVAGAGSINNAFIMRLSYSFITWTDHWTNIIVDMADAIRDNMESTERQQRFKTGTETRKLTEELWKKKGIGYGDDENS